MKKLVVLFFTGIAFSFSLKAQMTDIYTPMCNPVLTWILNEDSDAERRANDVEYTTRYPAAIPTITYNGISSTNKFNCHGYAWLREEGGPDRWIGVDGNENGLYPDIYINDSSYIEVSRDPWPYPAKVFWDRSTGGDHSAVTTPTEGIVISKWNKYPLMKHGLDTLYHPFGAYEGVVHDLKFYVEIIYTSFSISGPGQAGVSGSSYTLYPSPKCSVQWDVTGPFVVTPDPNNPATVTIYYTGANFNNGTLTAKLRGGVVGSKTITPSIPSISGPNVICPCSSYIFSAIDAPQGYTWSYSNNLTPVSTSGNSKTFYVNNGSSGTASVAISMGSTLLASKNINIGEAPVLEYSEIEGPDVVGAYGTYAVNVIGGTAPYQYNWYIDSNIPYYYYYIPYWSEYTDMIYIDFNVMNYYYPLYVKVSNACGSDMAYKSIYANYRGGSFAFYYPNPVDDILTVDLDAFSAGQSSNSNASFQTAPNYDVRLYDGFGVMVRQIKAKGGTVQFNVSNLSNGFYYLHVYDGVKNKPEMAQVIVQH